MAPLPLKTPRTERNPLRASEERRVCVAHLAVSRSSRQYHRVVMVTQASALYAIYHVTYGSTSPHPIGASQLFVLLSSLTDLECITVVEPCIGTACTFVRRRPLTPPLGAGCPAPSRVFALPCAPRAPRARRARPRAPCIREHRKVEVQSAGVRWFRRDDGSDVQARVLEWTSSRVYAT